MRANCLRFVLADVGRVRTCPSLDIFVDTDRWIHVEALRRRRVPEGEVRPRIDVPAAFPRRADEALCPAAAVEELRLRLQLARPSERDDATVYARDGEALRRTNP